MSDYFVSVLEAPALNMGVFVGIIAGFVGATAYNKYYNFRKLPDALSFFNGKRFVPFVVIFRSAIVALFFQLFGQLFKLESTTLVFGLLIHKRLRQFSHHSCLVLWNVFFYHSDFTIC